MLIMNIIRLTGIRHVTVYAKHHWRLFSSRPSTALLPSGLSDLAM